MTEQSEASFRRKHKKAAGKMEEKILDTAKTFDYDNLLLLLRQLREQEAQAKEEARRRHERACKSEARHQHDLFDHEYVKGKGMKNGGYGGLLVGRHYTKVQETADLEKEREQYSKWLANYNKKMEESRRLRRQKEYEDLRRRELMN